MGLLSIAVCIPCDYRHVGYLDECLQSIAAQTLLPKEVVVIISGVPVEKDDEVHDAIEILQKKYKLTMFFWRTSDEKTAGQNRNSAVNNAEADIISFLDADDTMRSDRLYTVQKVFQLNPNLLGILHYFEENSKEEKKQLPNFSKSNIVPYTYSEKLHFGHASFKKTLFNEFTYSDTKRGQDIEFVHNVIQKYLDNMCIYTQPLSYYNSLRSTFY